MKKVFSLLLAVLMLVSALPVAYAADTNDHSQGTQVVFEAANSESYTITVPASLKPGQGGTVTLAGEWPDNKTISVTADKTVTLTNSIKAADTKTLDVNFDGISETGSNIEAQTFTAPVSVDPIENAIFGIWDGHFNYYVTSNTEEPAVIGSATFGDGVTLTVSELGLEENAVKYGYCEMDFSKDFYFSYCSSLVSAIVPTGARTVYFQGCENLVSVVLPSDMTKIDSSAFWDCSSLTSIEIPDNVTIIDDGAFCGAAIEHITIPANVTYIGYTSFFNCTALRSINFDGTVEQWNAIEFGEDWNKDVPATKVVCSDGTVALS